MLAFNFTHCENVLCLGQTLASRRCRCSPFAACPLLPLLCLLLLPLICLPLLPCLLSLLAFPVRRSSEFYAPHDIFAAGALHFFLLLPTLAKVKGKKRQQELHTHAHSTLTHTASTTSAHTGANFMCTFHTCSDTHTHTQHTQPGGSV